MINHNNVLDIDDDLIEMTLNTSHGRISSWWKSCGLVVLNYEAMLQYIIKE